jgi:hypothetical protein
LAIDPDWIRRINKERTIRLVSTARLRDPVLLELVGEDALEDLAEIEGATSGRLKTEQSGSSQIDARELVFGIPHAKFINASFSYWLPAQLNRFNGPGRGAWYAGYEFETSLQEVSYHMTRELSNVGDFHATVDYAEMFASFVGDFVHVGGVSPSPDYLSPDPAIAYRAGNVFADDVRNAGHLGIVYPSLRHAGGTCLAALVPHAVQSVAQGRVVRLIWSGKPAPLMTVVSS